jgi:hypothetical protein
MLQPGDSVPHFELTTVDGARVPYQEIWQRKNLLLVSVAGAPGDDYPASIARRLGEFAALDTSVVVTRDAVPGVPAPGILIADRWGEIVCISPIGGSDRPTPEALMDWLRFIQARCPECEGEAR